ncbi:hypothetical protein [Kutzneria sp. 744]|uniref:hypothetical protein n=1 Tax=Kutzneria sp. (strain 744) TaxID=345341 RepID=UPI0003EEE080|nr:hypothetical protein [Kutzneria sp. 744]EWM19179.1 integral membrane protein [Kutzneria sp. 744]
MARTHSLTGGRGESGTRAPGRAPITARTLRTDAWWAYPASTFMVLLAFVVYSTYAALANRDYYADPYLSPFYSPCLSTHCGAVPGSAGAPHLGWFGTWWIITPAVIILIFPLGFRLTCYYYRKAYYRAFWLSPPACAVPEPRRRYTGETWFPLILQNIHRYFFYAAVAFNLVLTWDAVIAFDFDGHIGIGVGSAVLVINAVLLWLYTLSCHACRHAVGGRINNFSRHPVRYWLWTWVSRINPIHGRLAWASLVWVALTDLYVRLDAAGVLHDPRFV